ncbi:unnamed protein product [Calypogeia fissa]
MKSAVLLAYLGRLEGIASWIGGGLSSAFFSSLEKTSCVGLSVTEDSDSETGDGEELCVLQQQSRSSDQPLAGTAPKTRDRRTIRLTKNPLYSSDRFRVSKFHHVEFWCGDASNAWRRFSWGLGMNLVAKSDQSTGNQTYCSYVIQSNELVFSFTAPYSKQIERTRPNDSKIFNSDEANAFFDKHGLAVRAVGVLVDDAEEAFRIAVGNGAVGVLEPVVLTDELSSGGKTKLAEVTLYGDVVLRLVSKHGFSGPYLPNFEPVESLPISYGIDRLDHAVGNVLDLNSAAGYLRKFSGFHEVKELAADGVIGAGAECGLRSLALANNSETVVLQLNEPVLLTGKGRKSQIQSYLWQNEGPGVQHLALECEDIFSTLEEMHERTDIGGFEFQPGPPHTYYRKLPDRVKGILTEKQCEQCEELGVLVCVDEHGVVLHAFTESLGDRPTIFIELVQRVFWRRQSAVGVLVREEVCKAAGKVNCSKLFEAIEEQKKRSNRTKTAYCNYSRV